MYFYSNGQEKEGPVSLEELKQKDIQAKTLIWHEGLDDWKEAVNVDELREIFELSPPPLDTENDTSMDTETKDFKSKDKTIKEKIITSIILASCLTAIWSVTAPANSLNRLSLFEFVIDVIVGQFALHIPALIICFLVYAFKKKFNFTLYNIILCLMGIVMFAGNTILSHYR